MLVRDIIVIVLFSVSLAWGRAAVAQTGQPPNPVVEAAEQAKAEAEAQKAAYDAQKAAYEAKAAALKAAIGEVPASGITGSVDVATDAGKGEATLLSARAIADLAHALSSKVAEKIAETPSPSTLPAKAIPAKTAAAGTSLTGKTVRIFLGADKPELDSWQLFYVRKELLKKSAGEADTFAKQADSKLAKPAVSGGAKGPSVMGFAPVAGLALSTLSKLGAFFQSEYKIGGITLSPDEIELGNAVAGNLSAMCPSAKVLLAGTMPTVTGGDDLYKELVDLAEASTSAQARAGAFEQNVKDIRVMAAAETNAEKRVALADTADTVTKAMTALQTVATGYDSLITSLTTKDANGVFKIDKVIEQREIQNSLAAGELVLFLKTNAAVGGYYTKKNLWTFLGGMPFYTMGGAVVSYSLIDGPTGAVKLAGVVTRHGGYQKLAKAVTSINKDEQQPNPVGMACE